MKDPVGTITREELNTLAEGWRELQAQRLSVAWHMSEIERERTAGNLDEVTRVWISMTAAWGRLAAALEAFEAGLWAAFTEDLPTIEVVEIPRGENAIKWLLEIERDKRPVGWVGSEGEVVRVDLPAGDVPAVTLGNDPDKHDTACVTWVGEATIEVHGHRDGSTRICAPHAYSGWGSSVTLDALPRNGATWAGRVRFFDHAVELSGHSCVSTVTRYGDPSSRTPFKEVLFERVAFVDHRDPSVWGKWGVSCAQAAISAIDCVVRLERSHEHWIYVHSPYNVATEIGGNRVDAIGGQVYQAVARPEEGPSWGRSLTTIRQNLFTGYGRDCSRAATAITIAGDACDYLIEDNVVYDLDPSGCFGPGRTGGSIVVWDGGTFYGTDGTIVAGKPSKPDPHPAGVFANGEITIRENVFAQLNAQRAPVALRDGERFLFEHNAVVGGPCDLETENIGSLVWRDNNRPEDLARARALVRGLWDPLRDDRVKIDGANVGAISGAHGWG